MIINNLLNFKNLRKEFSSEELFVLCLLSFRGELLTDAEITNNCTACGFTTSAYNVALSNLQRKRCVILQFGQSIWQKKNTVAPSLYFQTAYELLGRQSKWLNHFQKSVPPRAEKLFLWELAKAAYANDIQRIKDLQVQSQWMVYPMDQYLQNLVAEECFLPVFVAVKPSDYIRIFKQHLEQLLEADALAIAPLDTLEKLSTQYFNYLSYNGDELQDVLEAYRFFCDGRTPEWKNKGASLWKSAVEGIRSLYAGNNTLSDKQFDDFVRKNGTEAAGTTPFDHPLIGFYLMLSYALNPTEAKQKRAEQLLKKEVAFVSSRFPAKVVAKLFTQESLPANLVNNFDYYLLQTGGSPLSAAFTHLFSSALQLDLSRITHLDRKNITKKPQCGLLRYELSAFEKIPDAEALQAKLGPSPLLRNFQKKQPWENAIRKILDFKATLPEASDGSTKSTRIVYLVDRTNSIEVREQKLLRNGLWSSGVPLNFHQFTDTQRPSMDDLDFRIVGRLLRFGSFAGIANEAITLLVGSGRIFFDGPDGLEPVKVVSEKPFLLVNKNGDRYDIGTNLPTDHLGRILMKEHIVKRCNDTYYLVFHLTPFEQTTLSTLLALKSFPKESLPELKGFLNDIASHIEIHSPLLKGGSSLTGKNGESVIVLRIVSEKENFHIVVRAQPLSGGRLHVFPGQGSEVVFDEIDGTRYQVRRDLAKEKENYELLYRFVVGELNQFVEAGEFNLSLEELLAVLEFVQIHSDQFAVEWPEGESVRIKALVPKSGIRIDVKKKSDWFEMEGMVQLGKNAMSIREFLSMVGNGLTAKRFVRLSDNEFAALTETVSKQLQRLESITQMGKKEALIPFYQVGMLAEIVNESAENVTADAELSTLAEKIEAAARTTFPLPKGLQAELRNYQLEGFQWMARLSEWGAGGCLADDMGLGKTLQSITFILHKAAGGPTLVVCPASVVHNWSNEIHRFAPALTVKILNEADDRAQLLKSLQPYDVLVCTYGMLVREEENLTATDWCTAVLDEAHTIKNRETKMSGAAMKLRVANRLILTGTPIQNYLSELWNLFQFLNPGLLGTYESFLKRFIIPIEHGAKGRQMQLRKLILPFLLRRTKSQVVEELPEKEEIVRYVELAPEEMSAYEIMREEAKTVINKEKKLNINTLAKITKLRKASCAMSLVHEKWTEPSSKIEELHFLVSEIIENNSRVLIFSQFTEFLGKVKETIEKIVGADGYFYLDGSVPLRKRDEMVQQFQHGEKSVFLISLKAGGVGLNLTGANYVIHLDPWWNPAIEQQATDRAYRIGQSQNVTVYHLISEHTIEEKILRMHKSKRDLADSLLNGTDVSRSMTLDDLRALVADDSE